MDKSDLLVLQLAAWKVTVKKRWCNEMNEWIGVIHERKDEVGRNIYYMGER